MPGSAGVVTPCVLYAIWHVSPINVGSNPILPVTQIAQVVEHYTSDVAERGSTPLPKKW